MVYMRPDHEPSNERTLAIGLAIQAANIEEERYMEDGVTYRSIVEHEPLAPEPELQGTPDGHAPNPTLITPGMTGDLTSEGIFIARLGESQSEA